MVEHSREGGDEDDYRQHLKRDDGVDQVRALAARDGALFENDDLREIAKDEATAFERRHADDVEGRAHSLEEHLADCATNCMEGSPEEITKRISKAVATVLRHS